MFNEIETDPVNMILSTPLILAPPKRKKPDEWMDMWKGPGHLLLVVICLATTQPDSSARNSTEDQEKAPNGLKPDRDAASAPAAAPQTRIGFLRLSYSGYGTSPHNRACDLGITLTAPYQDKGYGTEAVGWALDWAFRHANLHSVNLGSVEYNTRAHKCYEKCGFRFEGRRRQCCWHDRRWYDLLFFSILEDEWEEMRRNGTTQGVPSSGVEKLAISSK